MTSGLMSRISRHVGPYEILTLVGAGGMGVVYRARDTRLGRDVALKVMLPEAAASRAALERFEREARAVATLSHPNILTIHDFGSHEDSVYAVMEFLDGPTLRTMLERGPLPVRKAVAVAVQIAHGLAAAHECGIVHRDLKPENVGTTRTGQVKILDFGLARDTSRSNAASDSAVTRLGATSAGLVLGTVGYMAPEQIRGEDVDHRADVFSLGVVLYEMLTSCRAFARPTAPETLTAILNDEPPHFEEAGVEIPPALERVIRRCMEKNPWDRFCSARDLAFALENALAPDSGMAAAPSAG
jgi:serine/threonine protein kinase